MADGTYLVVGLGNPGPTYAGNRHNVGQMVLDVLAREIPGGFVTHKARAQVLDGRLGVLPSGAPGPRVVLAKPSTYMNLSGGPVAALVRFYDVPLERLLVIHDELDLPPATLRLKRGGGEGGHNGLKSVSAALGSKDYLRLRVGIGRPPGRQDPAEFVLRDFAVSEREDLAVTLEEAADGVRDVVENGLVLAQDRLHAPR
ncbi:aminoacyl-tRNA hydrolase [Pseudactinotalea suaedae]|jgi:PTH1 family peptidyl-tRNA hydrolase|uniref:aminoacyl-tRNA hydrolase n=1 Tax=Pseudactinotalea suaedae TaxID=1524924 RepID=UPI0012E20471|nr:aminoacyl-tRNA hydrolase [Pseudactinotalea suaedae]